jgi:1-acyl-sn-glycerol-3-phosphate acyltransferase
MANRMVAGEDVLLFGEGTSSDGEGVLSFKPSHFAAARDALRLYPQIEGVSVQPAAIAYTHARGKKLDPAGRRSLAWFGDAELAPHIWLLLKSAPVECVVCFGAPITFDCASDRKAIALETERRVRELAAAQSAA